MEIKISDIKKIRENLGMTHIVIFAIDNKNYYHVATHGDTKRHSAEAADAGNYLKKQLGFPIEDCKSVPLNRVCDNCDYWKRNHHPGYPIEEYGYCYYEIKPLPRKENDRACNKFEPKY